MRTLGCEPVDPLDGHASAADGQATNRNSRQRLGALVVDDDHLVRVVLQLGLERAGYSVWIAFNGREGVHLYRKHQDLIDVVLLDLCMPVMDGPTTLDELIGINREVRVCIMSGDLGDHDTEDLRRRGAACFIAKPFRLYELIDLLESFAPRVAPLPRGDPDSG